MTLQRHAGTIAFGAMMALIAIVLGLLNAQAPSTSNTTPVASMTFSVVGAQPAERPPEADGAKLTISPEIVLAGNESYLPTAGVITDTFGSRGGSHNGLDIGAPIGTPVYSAGAGTVEKAGYNIDPGGYGNYIQVRQDDGYVMQYGHLSVVDVFAGSRVDAGQYIGQVGSAGSSTGPHLHWRVSDAFGNGIDPMNYSAATPNIASSAAASAAPAPAPVQSGPDWDHLAMCESSGNWAINTGNGYYGGLQIDIPTWNEYGGQQYASRADFATRDQQVAVADKVLVARGGDYNAASRTWPGCTNGKASGWWKGGGAPVATPAPAPVVDAPAPTWTTPEVAPVQEPIVETLPAPAQTWVDNAVESLPEPAQAPVQQWIEQQVTPVPAPAYTAPVAELPQFDAAPAPSLPAFDTNAAVDAVTDFVSNTPALSDNPVIAGAVAQLPGLLGIG